MSSNRWIRAHSVAVSSGKDIDRERSVFSERFKIPLSLDAVSPLPPLKSSLSFSESRVVTGLRSRLPPPSYKVLKHVSFTPNSAQMRAWSDNNFSKSATERVRRLLREIEEDGSGLESTVSTRGLGGGAAGGIEGIKSDLRDVNDKMHSHRVILDRMVPLHRLLGANTAVSEEVDNKYYELAERMPELEGYRSKKITDLYAINENAPAPSTYMSRGLLPNQGVSEVRSRLRRIICKSKQDPYYFKYL